MTFHELKRELICKKCNEVIETYPSWVEHMRAECSKLLYKCIICGKGFERQHILKTHERVHSQERPFKCNQCCAAFKQRVHLIKHWEHLHPEEWKGKSSLDSSQQRSDDITKEHLLHECSICKLGFSTEGGLTRHLQIHANEPTLDQMLSNKCHNCGEEFRTKFNLQVHLRNHKVSDDVLLEIEKQAIQSQNYNCTVCERVFCFKGNFLNHLKKHSSGSTKSSKHLNDLTCPVCQLVFSSPYGLISHKRAHAYQQDLSSEADARSSLDESHHVTNSPLDISMSTNDDIFKCRICDFTCYSEKSLQSHAHMHRKRDKLSIDVNVEATDNGLGCDICGEIHTSKDALKEHFSKYHKESSSHSQDVKTDVDEQCKHECQTCKEGFSTADALKCHLQKQHREQESKDKNQHREGESEDQKQHRGRESEEPDKHPSDGKNFNKQKCDICETIYQTPALMQKHLQEHIANDKLSSDVFLCETMRNSNNHQSHCQEEVNEGVEQKQRFYKCNVCESSFHLKGALHRHILHVHALHSPRQSSKPSFTCPTCNTAFIGSAQLQKHQIKEHHWKPFSCDICPLSFKVRYKLKVHKQNVHSGDKPFKCSECDQCFPSKRYLNRHKRNNHLAKPFKCKDCNKAFSDKYRLNKHLEIHTDNKPFKCSQCLVSFNKEYTLRAHMLRSHGDQKYACDICQKKFGRMRSLNVHKLNNHTEGDFPCSNCEKTFRCLKYLQNHERRIHLGLGSHRCTLCKMTFKSHSVLRNHHQLHRCKVCGKKYKRLDYVVNYMRVHSGERPFKCVESCGKMFVHQSVLTKHQEVCKEKHKPRSC